MSGLELLRANGKMTARRRVSVGSVILLIASGCAGGGSAAPTPSEWSTASSHGAPTPRLVLPAHGRIVFSLQIGNPVIYCNLVTIEPDAASRRMITNVAAGSGCYADPVWTPKGDRIVFDIVTNTSDHLFAISAAGGSIRQLTSGSWFDSDPAISPDGRQIAFDRGGGPNPPAPGIFLMNVDGSHIVRITTPPDSAAGGDAYPSFSPDGTKLAFVRNAAQDGEGAIFVVGVDGRDLRQVTPGAYVNAARPHWSPDGSKLLFGTPGSALVGRDVYVVNADGSGLIPLTHMYGASDAENPSWSPDGTMIIFDQYQEGIQFRGLVVMRADGSNPVVIWHPTPNTDVFPVGPAWGTAW